MQIMQKQIQSFLVLSSFEYFFHFCSKLSPVSFKFQCFDIFAKSFLKDLKKYNANKLQKALFNKHYLVFKWLQKDSNPRLIRSKTTFNHLAKLDSLAKWWSVCLQTKWLWVRIPLKSLKLQISRLYRAWSSCKFKQLQCLHSLLNAYVTW